MKRTGNDNNICLLNVEYKQTAIEKQKNFYIANKIQDTQGNTYIALTESMDAERGHLGHLQFTMVQFGFVSTLGHRKNKLKITNIVHISLANLILTSPSFDFIFKELQ